jgi:diguanylate cyclase (GGDEF)-like protein
LLTLDGIEEICHFAVQEVRELTGFDRVMIYRFDPDAHGCIIAEACRADAEPFLGLHYPASDIPRQARVMYLRNWIRVIADSSYTPVPIRALAGCPPVDTLDLSMSVLRSVSPAHLQYMRNMGVTASMTISLVVENQLWGMIACHHDAPMRLNHIQRLAYESLGQVMSVRLRAIDAAKHHARVRGLGQMAAQVVTAMAAAENPADGAVAAPDALLGMVAADGAVVEIDGVRAVVGDVPGTDALNLVVPRLTELAARGAEPVATDALADLLGMKLDEMGTNAPCATGALFLPLPSRVQGFILWLRGERARTVRWAGRLTEKADAAAGQDVSLTPRGSFAEWLQVVHGCSEPWRTWEVATATELADAMPEILQHRAQNRLVRLALHDPLTGLPNRVQLHDKLASLLIARTSGPGSKPPALGILYFDIDGFKAVNDTRGHHIGDELLVAVARRISGLIRSQDIFARMGGDEFVLLLPDSSLGEAVNIGQRIVEDFRHPMLLGGELQRSLTLSVGVAVVAQGTEPGEALRQADTAMYHAKRGGRDQVAVYDPASGTAASRQKLAADHLRKAVAAGEITVHYQPVKDLQSADAPFIVGFEALARWRHPTRGVLPPSEFIDLAENTGLIGALGDAVMRQALQQLQTWPDRRLSMAVNVSVQQLLSRDFPLKVQTLLGELGVAPARLCLEITESQMMEQPEHALAALTELVNQGVRIGIDDFGTGFSSISYLCDLPATILKIDRSFVSALPHNPKKVAVVAGIIQLAHSLGMRSVAEGVETAEQLATLRDLGCDFVQGYLLGKPMPAESITLGHEPFVTHFSEVGHPLELTSVVESAIG